MGKIPRRIHEQDVVGYVHCPTVGFLACGDDEDKEELLALADLVIKGIEKGVISKTSGRKVAIRTEEGRAFIVLQDHSAINPYSWLAAEVMNKIYKKMNPQKRFYINKSDFDKYKT